eukprot:9548730-Alexandrium_andersonii.AAC.1
MSRSQLARRSGLSSPRLGFGEDRSPPGSIAEAKTKPRDGRGLTQLLPCRCCPKTANRKWQRPSAIATL